MYLPQAACEIFTITMLVATIGCAKVGGKEKELDIGLVTTELIYTSFGSDQRLGVSSSSTAGPEQWWDVGVWGWSGWV